MPAYGIRTATLLICAAGLGLTPRSAGGQSREPVTVFYEVSPDGTYQLLVTTEIPCPIQLLVEFPSLVHVRPNEPLPLDFVVVPHARRAKMTTLTPTGPGSSFRYTTRWWIGDPETARHDDTFLYRLPYRTGAEVRIIQGYNGSSTHQGEYALDFLLSEGEEVRAARGGVVAGTKDDSRVGGPDKALVPHANYVIVYHADGSFAEYMHMKYKGVAVRVGQEVVAGDLLGYSGNTGFTYGPHLHFSVRLPTYHSSRTIPTRFTSFDGRLFVPR